MFAVEGCPLVKQGPAIKHALYKWTDPEYSIITILLIVSVAVLIVSAAVS